MSDPIIPTPDQLAENRRTHWHQNGDALLTAEAALPWINRAGLLLFAPRGQQFAAPAPTLVEATLGAPSTAPTVADREPARSLLGRLVAQGDILPLNLLGAPGTTPDEPDFLVSATVFPYLFTLRGDKAWKQLPSATGPFKVSPLAVNTYALLSDSGPRSAADLANELGKGLTEAAVLRALSELWQHLRVFPVLQPDGATTLWELATARFTKSLKSGANAGQPSALSALITLYLGQAVLATEDEVESFLSPLAPRSRIRDVVHALTAARELESLVVEGKHCLYIHGEAPAFAPQVATSEATGDSAEASPALEGEGRIKKFGTGPRKPAFGKKPFSPSNRERRPFDRARGPVRKPAASRDTGKPAFNRPWDEERQQRSDRAAASSEPAAGTDPEFQDIDLDAASPETSARPAADRPRKKFGKPAFGDRKSFGDRGPASGDRKPFGDRPKSVGDRKPFGDRPRPPFGDRENRGPAKPFGARPGGGDRPAFSRNRDAAGAPDSRPPRPSRPSSAGEERAPFKRPSRPGFDRGGDRGPGRPPFRPSGDRPFRPRPDADGESRPPRRDFTGKPFDRKPRPDRAGAGPDSARPARPFRPRPEGAEPGRPPFKRFDARPSKSGGFSARPAPGGKRPFSRPGGKPGPGGKSSEGPFDKFKGGNKPWGKRPPARKIKPEEDQA